MDIRAFELREDYVGTVERPPAKEGDDAVEVPKFTGGVIAVPPDMTSFDVAAELEKRGGRIVVDARNTYLVDALLEYRPLKEVKPEKGDEAIGAYEHLTKTRLAELVTERTGTTPAKKLTKDELIALLNEHDQDIDPGSGEPAGDAGGDPNTGD